MSRFALLQLFRVKKGTFLVRYDSRLTQIAFLTLIPFK
jgi:hypothetical protein